jgi:hypothetical protein
MNKFVLIVGLLAGTSLASVALVGCGGGFSCDGKGKCANDTAPSSDAVTACKNAEAGACGSQYKDLANCTYSNATCDSSGKTDATAAINISFADGGLVVTGTCATQFNALTTCCTSNAGAAGCTAQ